MTVFIETERFILRELREGDAPGMFALDSDPEVHRFLGNNPVKTIQESEAIIRHVRRQYSENGIGRWAVADKTSGEFIGWAGLKYEKNLRIGLHYYDLGYRLRREFWGRGIASEVARASLQYGFEQLKLPEICAAAHLNNIASNKVLLKMGFTLKDTFELEGEMHNWYVLRKADWING